MAIPIWGFSVTGMALLALLLWGGCPNLDRERMCSLDAQCATISADGLCLDIGDGRRYCGYVNRSCMTMYAFSIDAPESLRHKCVPAALLPKDGGTDGATDAAPADAAPTPDGAP